MTKFCQGRLVCYTPPMAHALTNVKISRDDARCEAEIKAEIPAEVLERYRVKALKGIQAEARLDGFRPGKAPLERILAVYGEASVLKHAVEHALEHELPELLAVESLLPIEPPRVSMEPPQSSKPLPFVALVALMPKVELPEYKAVAKRHPPAGGQAIEVSNEEHEQALIHLRRERFRIEKMESGVEPQKASDESRSTEEKDLPALDDAFVQSLGYENVEKFSAALRTNIKAEKERQAKERRRAAILDELAKESKISYPAVLREYELNDMEERIRDDLSRIGRTYEEYLTEVKKTKEELRTNWKDAADKRVKIRLILTEIARKEHTDVDPGELERELEHAKKRYPSAPPETLRANLAHVMRNEAVFKFLETL